MSSYQNVNSFLWDAINGLGWWWWGVPAVLGAVNLYLMSKLDGPATLLGKSMRVANTVGFWLLAVSPLMNVAGCIALPLLVIGYTGIHYQMWQGCKAKATSEAPMREERPTIIGRLVQMLVNKEPLT